jgi:serine/threonine protein kinase
VKTLLPEYAARPSLRHRFEVEARTMSMLDAPQIVRVFDAGIDDDIAYMVMEFAEGGSVVDWIERYGPMPPRMAAEVAIALCEGIAVAHDQGIIHRDVKPQNLLIASDGTCKVTDFGIAQVVESERVTMTGMVMGTIGYMAPEQHESAKHTDERADIYSVAATLYTLAKGEAATHLFMADDKDFVGIPGPLAEVIRKGAQYRREARHATVREMADELRDCLPELPANPRGTPPLLAARPFLLEDVAPPTPSMSTSPVRRREEERRIAASLGSIEPPVATPTVAPAASDEDRSGPKVRLSQLTASGKFRVAQPYGYRLEEAARRRERIGMAVVALLFLALIGAGTGWLGQTGAVMIADAENHASDMRGRMYEALLDEWSISKELDALGLDTAEVDALFAQLDTLRDDDARYAAAVRLHNLLEQMRRQASKSSATQVHIVRALDARLERIDDAVDREKYAQQTVLEVRETLPGRVAGFFGS